MTSSHLGDETGAPTGVDREAIAAELLALEREERRLSELRRRLHEQIDNGFPNEFTIAREREVSDRRREVHARIDALVQLSGERITKRKSAGGARVSTLPADRTMPSEPATVTPNCARSRWSARLGSGTSKTCSCAAEPDG